MKMTQETRRAAAVYPLRGQDRPGPRRGTPKVNKVKKTNGPPTPDDDFGGAAVKPEPISDSADRKGECPKTRVYVGAGQGNDLEPLIVADYNEAQRKAETEKKSILGARRDAIGQANKMAEGKEPKCAPCCPALSIKFFDPALVEWETMSQAAGVTVLAKCAAKIKWKASWICIPCAPNPKTPPDNPGHKEWEGGEQVEDPCPHPFQAGTTIYEAKEICNVDESVSDDAVKIKKYKEEDYKKFLEEAHKKAMNEAFDALAKLPDCPEGCPQVGPTSFVFGPATTKFNRIFCTTEGKKTDHSTNVHGLQCVITYHWSVERNCMKEVSDE